MGFKSSIIGLTKSTKESRMLTCSVCKHEKPKHQFHKNSSAKSGHDSRCIPCKKSKRDLERQTSEYREWDAIRHQLWIQNNPEKYALLKNVRRTKEEQQIAPWTRNNKEELRLISGLYKHAKDLRDAYGIDFHVDHIVPLNSKFVCGFTCLANMEPLSREANLSKGNRRWPDMQEDLDYGQIVIDSETSLRNLAKKEIQKESGLPKYLKWLSGVYDLFRNPILYGYY